LESASVDGGNVRAERAFERLVLKEAENAGISKESLHKRTEEDAGGTRKESDMRDRTENVNGRLRIIVSCYTSKEGRRRRLLIIKFCFLGSLKRSRLTSSL
jgi:hypothetical protein